mmetsp:Transcript_27463/g.27342  ORF Transcript_27463/g.27342 Transcript_27463/m.27342 type:complete len:127 (-) Transcript_27463:151-531(-)
MSGDYKKALRGKYLKKHPSKDRYSKFNFKRQDRKSTTADTKDIQNKASLHRSPDMNRILRLSKPRHVSSAPDLKQIMPVPELPKPNPFEFSKLRSIYLSLAEVKYPRYILKPTPIKTQRNNSQRSI